MRLWMTVIAFSAVLFLSRAMAAENRQPVDYAQPASWLCLPGRPDACASDLDAMAFSASGERTPKKFAPQPEPAIDCFYIYPTVSQQPGVYSDLAETPAETRAVRSQAARFAASCKVYAPLYRQVTLSGLHAAFTEGFDKVYGVAYEDVRAAWRAYLASYNHGRGVILIGHSQGTEHLNRLIAEEIEGKPAQGLLVAAYLAGNATFVVPKGSDVGGTFKSVPLCRSSAQVGCAVVWSSYAADDADTSRFFGRDRGNGMAAACVNPAALSGGKAPLDGYIPKPAGGLAADPPWVEMAGQLEGDCVSDGEGTVFRVGIVPGRYEDFLKGFLTYSKTAPGWGLHRVDMNIVEGDLVALARTQAQAWSRRGQTP